MIGSLGVEVTEGFEDSLVLSFFAEGGAIETVGVEFGFEVVLPSKG